MDETPATIASLDDDETPETGETAAENGPLATLVELGIASATVASGDSSPKSVVSQPSTRATEYAAGTTEHEDDREG